MKSRIVKTFAIAALATTLAACSSTKTTTTDTGTTGTQTGAVMDPFNPNSPLAQQRSVFFGFDQYNVEEQYLPLVQMHAQYLAANGQQRIRIEGNTDARGSSEYNLALGQRRSVAVAQQLVNRGVNGAQIEAVSFGKERPAAQGWSEEAHAQNRRADINYIR
ncbi:15 kDa peptidoglycan-associated lipoprotein [Oligella ureolytica]|uniref:Peptidoglycan-associated lipoprotein n=1 Tax=Oligella ureolytica TaxID=90244 RepID=A0A378XHB7_9BURK|nr:peptidoglycan-associated lipoprotein Pal [Oligella ureolytica]QPT39296.1 peptidoglycan-associated lipoprotein Pal [Oligella ureolytica]SUA55550.1 15 kDa peptidoglycan-associated lipoprotein [Oligella ureolytica]SUA56848.1 15 kDa peptidoglycan-associated lipoprotein [Oligella ureolytica]